MSSAVIASSSDSGSNARFLFCAVINPFLNVSSQFFSCLIISSCCLRCTHDSIDAAILLLKTGSVTKRQYILLIPFSSHCMLTPTYSDSNKKSFAALSRPAQSSRLDNLARRSDFAFRSAPQPHSTSSSSWSWPRRCSRFLRVAGCMEYLFLSLHGITSKPSAHARPMRCDGIRTAWGLPGY